MSGWADRPTDWAPGQYPRGAGLEAILDQIEANTAPGVTDFSTGYTIVGSTTNPTLGNSVLQAYYRRPMNSDLVDFWLKLTIGSTFSVGSGHYEFPLPFNEASPQLGCGSGTIFDTGTAFYTANCISIAAGRVIMYIHGSGAALGSGGHGLAAWATGDYIQAHYPYIAA